MTFTSKLLPLTIGFASGSLALGFGLLGLWLWLPLIGIIGILWWLEAGKKREWGAGLFLVCFLGMAVIGVRMDVNAGLMLMAVIASLSTWDLFHFLRRLEFTPKNEGVEQLESAHFRRLAAVDCAGFLLASIALTIKIEIGLGTILFLTALAVVCLSRFINSLRRESD